MSAGVYPPALFLIYGFQSLWFEQISDLFQLQVTERLDTFNEVAGILRAFYFYPGYPGSSTRVRPLVSKDRQPVFVTIAS